jgi:tetratricopeptide (TPR) repeat protein
LVVGGGQIAYRTSQIKRVGELRMSCERARRNGDWPEMERVAREWANLEPGRVTPWTMAAAAARAMGELELCAQYLAQLPDTAPVEAFHELSLLQMESLVQPLAARDTCQRALKQYPADVESSARLMFIHAMMCNREALIAEAERAIRAGADSRSTYAYWVSASWLTFSNGYDINHFWLEKQPVNESFEVAAVAHQLFNRDLAGTSTQTDNGQLQPASTTGNQKQLQSLMDRYPKNRELLAVSLTSLIQMGDVAKFAAVLSSVPPGTENDNRFWRFRGWYHSANEEWEMSAKAYEKALQLCPVDFSSQIELAGVLRRTQGIEAAKDIQAKATLGTEVALSILRATSFESIPDAEYRNMATYLELCGKTEFAQRLRSHCE